MNKWKLLGIEQTKDEDAIKNAYRTKLTAVNPEDDPEGFMALRRAYEEAVQEAQKEDSEEEGEEEKDPLVLRLKEIYEDFSKRIDVEVWKELLSEDAFVSLEQAEESREKVLVFVMDHSFLPHDVMKLLVESFRVVEEREELEELFPKNFIEFIIRNAAYKDTLDYSLFDVVGEDVDYYIHVYYQLYNAIQNVNAQDTEKYLEELLGLKSSHPYLAACEITADLQSLSAKEPDREKRNEQYKEELLELQSRADAFLERYPENVTALHLVGDLAMSRRDLERAREIFQRTKELVPDDYHTKGQLAELAILDGEFEKSRDIFMEMLDINRYDEGARLGMVRANEGLIGQYKEKMEAEPENLNVKIDLLWCYYRNGMFDEGLSLITSFEPNEDVKVSYYNLLGRMYFYAKQYEQALEGFLQWRQAVIDLPDTDDMDMRKKKEHGYQYSHYFLGETCINLKRYDEARKYLAVALEREFDEIIYAYEAMCRLEYEAENYEACVRAGNKLLERDWENYDACIYMAKSLYELKQYGMLLDICDRAIMIYPYISEPYILKIRVYWNVDQFDDMRAVIEQYERFECTSDEIEYNKARLANYEGDQEEQVIEYLQGILDRKESGETDLDGYAKVYTLYAYNTHILGDFERELELYEAVREETDDPWYVRRSYLGRAAAYGCMLKLEEAKREFEACEEKFGLDDSYVIDHGEILVRMGDMEGCAALLKKAMELVKDDPSLLQSMVGNLCCFYGNEGYLEESREMFELGIKLQPDDCLMYRSLGYVYLEHGRYEEARELLEKAIELDTEEQYLTRGLLVLAISKLDDIHKEEYKDYVDAATEQFAEARSDYALIKKAEFYRGLGKYEEALSLLQKVLDMKRSTTSAMAENDSAWDEMGNVYAEMGDVENAMKCYERSLAVYGHSGLCLAAIARLKGEETEE